MFPGVVFPWLQKLRRLLAEHQAGFAWFSSEHSENSHRQLARHLVALPIQPTEGRHFAPMRPFRRLRDHRSGSELTHDLLLVLVGQAHAFGCL